MKRIGLLGGMSWESTELYYRVANETVKARLGGLHSAELILASVDFAPIAKLQAEGRWDEAGVRLAAEAVRLERAGAELLVLATNTMHRVADAVERAITIPFVHIADPTGEAIRAAGVDTVGLLGTRFTMEQAFYADRLRERHGLAVFVPAAADRDEIHRVIYEELCLGKILDASRAFYRDAIARLVARGARGVILGCTEITLLVGQADSPVPTFDTTRLHAERAVELALA